MMMRSTPAFSVIVDTGQLPHAPTRVTWTTSSASMPLKTMSPPSLWSAGRIASIASSTPASRSSMVSVDMFVSLPPCGPGYPARGRPLAGELALRSPLSTTPSISHASPGPPNRCPQGPQLRGEIGVAPVDVMRLQHPRLAVGRQAGEHQGRPRPHVLGPHRRAREPLDAPDDRVAAVVADVGAHAVELVDEPEAV